MEDLGEILQSGTESLADGLMTQADTQHGFAGSIGADDIKEQACLGRYAWTRRKDDFVEGFKVGELELVVAQHGYFGAQRLHQMTQVVGK